MNHSQAEPSQPMKAARLRRERRRRAPAKRTGRREAKTMPVSKECARERRGRGEKRTIHSGGHMGTARQQSPEQMEVEVIGGPFDGTLLELNIVRVGERDIRVLRKTYEPMFELS